jgi:adenylosuccinate synthase
MPFDIAKKEVELVYNQLDGWEQSLEQSIPQPLETYLSFLEEQLDTPISRLSVGPERNQTLTRETTSAS